ncbi:outer membrane protein [Phreatobacter aquaticus]|nr:outer membrane protein [Phreatobacter aquaticus]
MKKLLLAGAAIAALSTGAQAADLGAPRMPIAAAVIAPVFSWTGVYAGAHIGYGFGQSRWSDPATGISVSPNTNGILGGVQIGYNYQINNLVLGLEADASAADLHGWRSCPNAAFTCASRANFLGTVRARAGYAVDRALYYVTGGLAIGNFKHREYTAAPVALVGTYNTTRLGLALGAGVEYAVAQNWTVKAEYMYHYFGNSTALTPTLDPVGDVRIRSDIHTVKLGVNYLFSTGPGAVVARY